MHWFLDPIKNHYVDFSGRATRQEFWMFILFYVLFYTVVSVVSGVLGLEELALLCALAVILPAYAITARRLHDIGRSGWWQLIGFVPFVGLIVMIVFLVMDSQPGANKFGPNPKGVSAPDMDASDADMASIPDSPEAQAPIAEVSAPSETQASNPDTQGGEHRM